MTMTINGSGTVTGLTAGGLPDATVQQADLAANVAGNGPAFSAYQTVAQGLTGVDVTLSLDTKEFDTATAFSANKFQPTVAGYYQINAVMQVSGTSTVSYCVIYKNGVAYRYGALSGASGSNPFSTVSALVFLNGTTDYVSLCGASTPSLNTNPGIARVAFSGYLARSV